MQSSQMAMKKSKMFQKILNYAQQRKNSSMKMIKKILMKNIDNEEQIDQEIDEFND